MCAPYINLVCLKHVFGWWVTWGRLPLSALACRCCRCRCKATGSCDSRAPPALDFTVCSRPSSPGGTPAAASPPSCTSLLLTTMLPRPQARCPL